ncbi:MAG: hypothetical protein Q9171_004570 [Xanthocarpia ochracea]
MAGQDTQDCHVPGGFRPQAIEDRDIPNQEVLSTNAHRARQSCRIHKRFTPSQLRAQDAIQVINATFAACAGKHLNNETRFAIVAMFLPQRKRAIFAEPGSSLYVPGARFPFLVIEAAVSQTDRSLRTKAHHWIQGNGGHLKILCLLQLRRTNGPEGYHAVVTIIRPRKVTEPTAKNPEHFCVEANHIFHEVEVFPTIPTGIFDMTLEDVLPKNAILDASTSDKHVTISLEIFYDTILQLTAMLEYDRLRGSSPFNPNQKEVPTMPDSTEASEPEDEESQPDNSESEDPTFEVMR